MKMKKNNIASITSITIETGKAAYTAFAAGYSTSADFFRIVGAEENRTAAIAVLDTLRAELPVGDITDNWFNNMRRLQVASYGGRFVARKREKRFSHVWETCEPKAERPTLPSRAELMKEPDF